jgi:hypothetical protein
MTEISNEKKATQVSAQETQAAGGVSVKETPAETAGDAKGQPSIEELQAELDKREKALEKATQDINSLKSSYQRREGETKAEYDNRMQAMQTELDGLRTAGLDETGKLKYELQRRQEQLTEAEKRAQAAEARAQDAADSEQWGLYFKDFEIDFRELEGATLQERISAGLNIIRDQRLEGGTAPKKQPVKGKQPLEAPEVVTETPREATHKETWPELIQKYKVGNEHESRTIERIFAMVDQGKLSADVILPKP